MTATGARALTATGRHSDGGGLYLRIQKGGRKSWCFMWKRHGKQREVGLGSFRDVSLKAARFKAQSARDALAMNIDPREVLQPVEGKTFLETAKACMKARKVEEMNSATQRKWERTAIERCKSLHSRDVATINREDILRILKPIWTKTPETARIARSHLEIILDYAEGRGWRDGTNPAKWRGGLETVLKKHNRKDVKHHAAMEYDALPAFMSELCKQEPLSARALELLILTATRTSETRCAVAREFDLKTKLWTIPAERMKMGVEHEIPLSEPAVQIIEPLIDHCGPGDFLFPGQKAGKPLSNMAMAQLLRRMGHNDITVHGFRSTFRDWAGDRTTYPEAIAEAALAHSLGTGTEKAYRRKRALEKRRALMSDWAFFIGGKSASILTLVGGRKA